MINTTSGNCSAGVLPTERANSFLTVVVVGFIGPRRRRTRQLQVPVQQPLSGLGSFCCFALRTSHYSVQQHSVVVALDTSGDCSLWPWALREMSFFMGFV